MRKAYIKSSSGQIHLRYWNEGHSGLPLLCLPPAPHTGLYFHTFATHYDGPLITLDYPGTGGSTPLETKPAIEDYARIIGGLLPKIGKVNVMGFHSGCLIALELIESFGAQIEHVFCVDFPLFDKATREKFQTHYDDVKPPQKPEELSLSFESTVIKRRDQIGEGRALELWVESLRAGPRYNDIFQAAFICDAEKALSSCKAPIDFIATHSPLHEPTKRAVGLTKKGRLTEVMEITGNVFETGAELIASTIRNSLQ